MKIEPTKVTRYLLVVLLLFAAFGQAQTQSPQETPSPNQATSEAPSGSPEAAADEAVRAWLDRPATNLTTLTGLPPEELCRQLPSLLGSPPIPEGTRVNFDDRVEREVTEEGAEEGLEGARRYTYPVSFPNGRLEVLEVTLQEREGTWAAESIGIQRDSGGTIPRVFQQPVAAWAFALFSLYFVWLLLRPSFFRRWLLEGWTLLRGYRGLVIGTFVVLYGLFALGLGVGASLPSECQSAVASFVETTVEELGAAEAYGSGNVARAAVVTLYQNFVMGTLVTTFSLTFITLGIGAYLLNGLRFLAIGVPFGFLVDAGPLNLLFVLILIVVELSAYVIVTAGGGIFLMTVIRQGFSGFREGARKLIMMLPIAFLLLMLGAWYEAVVVILAAP